jgi:hypothetical protein
LFSFLLGQWVNQTSYAAVEPERLQGQHDESASSVLRERLVDLERDRRARARRTIDEVRCDQLLRNVLRDPIHSRKTSAPLSDQDEVIVVRFRRRLTVRLKTSLSPNALATVSAP